MNGPEWFDVVLAGMVGLAVGFVLGHVLGLKDGKRTSRWEG